MSSDLSALVEDVFVHTLTVVRSLDHDAADLPTDCPGWTVRDQVSHMVGLERVLGGDPHPVVELPALAHIVTDFDRYMEANVHIRRGLPLQAIADELAGLLPRRLAQLRALIAEGDADVIGPFGPRPISASLPIRVFDLWAHEQDIRRATGNPVRSDCTAAHISLSRTLQAWSGLLAKAEGVDGQLTIQATDSDASVTIALGTGASAAATLSADTGVLTWLGCGRGPLSAVRDQVTIDGDISLIDAVAPTLGFTP